MWIVNFIKEVRLILYIKKTYRENKDLFLSKNLKIDWLGQLYTVINRDINIQLGSEKDKSLLMLELLDINQVIELLGLQLMLSFICEPHESVDENYYLVVFTPTLSTTKSYVNKKSIISLFLATIILIISVLLFIILL